MKFYRDSKTGDLYIRNGGKFQKFFSKDDSEQDQDDLDYKGNSSELNDPDDTENSKQLDSNLQNSDESGQGDNNQNADGEPGDSQNNSGQMPGGNEKPSDDSNSEDGSERSGKGNSNLVGKSGEQQGITDKAGAELDMKNRTSSKIRELKKLMNDEKFMSDVAAGLEPEVINSKLTKDSGQFTDFSKRQASAKDLGKDAKLLLKSIRDSLLAQAYEVNDSTDYTYARPDMKRLAGANIITKGAYTKQQVKKTKPVLNVYQDVSVSFNKSDLELSNSVVDSLLDLQDLGIIEVRHKYFASKVGNSISEAGDKGSTNGIAVFEDILEERPLNVMIVTDSDVSAYAFSYHKKNPIKLKGNVWYVWKHGNSSDGFLEYVRGKKVFQFNME